jgi:Putative DNA-binding domain
VRPLRWPLKAVEHSPGQGRYSPLTAIAEDHFHDRKSRRVTPAKLTKAMSAFANADGGELLVGIENDGAWDGFGKIEDCNGHFQAMEMLFPCGSEFNYEFLRLLSCASPVGSRRSTPTRWNLGRRQGSAFRQLP